jgi:hypothetical protein
VEGQMSRECPTMPVKNWVPLRQPDPDLPAAVDTRFLHPMSDLEGNFDVIILGTGLVESITAA